ncbi:MAG: hypothetical protein K0R47_2494 [Brevibacillus sp.]|nr:hypothetical protein [Brevibacillus sp.]
MDVCLFPAGQCSIRANASYTATAPDNERSANRKMQPYQYDQQQQNYLPEQGYQTIPEDQANPVFFGGRRRPEVIIIPQPYPYPPPYPYYYPYPYPYPYPYSPYGGGYGGGFGGGYGGGWGF